ncbi:MAG TPA: RNA-binding protein [Caulobacteraceae bacterium]|nr:RNA-binding protein [Caulobacteraceae bacterium]
MAAGRQRRDVASGEAIDEARLVRFVAGPDGAIVPDVARKLPGRGVWVAATRAAVEAAAARSLPRAAKARAGTGKALADQVEALLAKRVLDGLGLARRAGDLIFGFEKVRAAIAAGRTAWLVEASDGAPDGRDKLLALARRQAAPPKLLAAFTAGELGLALGLENVVHLAFLAGRGAERWTIDVQRLSGFRPLLPESWREEP